MKVPPRVLAVAALSRRVGYTFLIDGELHDWGGSPTAGRYPDRAAEIAAAWFREFRPDVIVTERIERRSRKGARTRRVIAEIAGAATETTAYDVSVPLPRPFKNKYDEAAALAKRFTPIAGSLPKRRRIWETEPWSTVYFEALALAVAVIDGTAPAARPEDQTA